MKITKRKIIGLIFAGIGIILLYRGIKFAYYYKKIAKLVSLAKEKLAANVEGKYFSLRHIDKIPVITLRGNPEYYMREYAKYFADVLRIFPTLVPHFFATDKKFEEFKNIAKNNVRYIPKFYLKELRYLARYSKINFQDLVGIHIFSDYFNYGSSFLCSVFVADKNRSKLNKIIIGRNLDYFVPFLKDLTVLHIFKRGKREFASIGFLGVFGVYSGINRNGIVISNLLALNPKEKPKHNGIPSSYLYRKILETQSNVYGAAKMLKNIYKSFSNNILLSDKKVAFIVEAYGDKIRIRKFKRGYVYTTNYIMSKDLRRTKHIGKRYRFLNRIAKTSKKLGIEDMKKVLDGVAMPMLTQHSIIFIPEDRKIYFSYGEIPSTKGPYIEIEDIFNLQRQELGGKR